MLRATNWSDLCPFLISCSHRFLFLPAPPLPFPLASALQRCSPLPAPTPSSCPRCVVGWYLSRRAGAGRVEQRAKAWLGFWNLSLSSFRGAAVAGPCSLRIFRLHLPADTKASPARENALAPTTVHTHAEPHKDVLPLHLYSLPRRTPPPARSRAQLCTRTHTGTRLRAHALVDQPRPAAQSSLSGRAHAEPRTEPHTRAHTRTLHAPGGGLGAVLLERRAGTQAGAAATAEEAERGSRERAGPRSSWRPGIFQPGR